MGVGGGDGGAEIFFSFSLRSKGKITEISCEYQVHAYIIYYTSRIQDLLRSAFN